MSEINNITVAFGCDHAGFEYKEAILAHLENKVDVIDCGCDSRDSVDYPVFADKVCGKVTDGDADLGILVCGTGIGMSIAANKHKGIRAAACENPYSSKMTRAHNDANVLCIGARVVGIEVAFEIIDAFLESEFMGGKHARRVDMINALDK